MAYSCPLLAGLVLGSQFILGFCLVSSWGFLRQLRVVRCGISLFVTLAELPHLSGSVCLFVLQELGWG